jgi:hypothetical protein
VGAWYELNECADLNSNDLGAYSPSQVQFAYHAATITLTNLGAPFTCGFTNAQGPAITGTGTTTQNYLSGAIMWHDLNFAPSSGNPITYVVNAKLALGWPAIWLLGGDKALNTGCQVTSPQNWDNDGTCNWSSDSSDSAEIDFAENVGATSGPITHTGQNAYNASTQSQNTSQTISDATANFHSYYVTVATNQICWGIDGTQSECESNALITHPMFLIIENRVYKNATGVPFPQVMTIEYVQVCQGTTCAAPDSTGGNTLFLDDFNNSTAPLPPSNLTVTVQ